MYETEINTLKKAIILLNNIVVCYASIEELHEIIKRESNKPNTKGFLFTSRIDYELNIKHEEKYIKQYKEQYNKLIKWIELFN